MSSPTGTQDYPARLAEALLALKKMRARLEAVEQASREPIAVIGIGCRFPGDVDSPQAFWQLLSQGIDAISEVPADRWDLDEYYDPDPEAPGKIYTRYGGFIRDAGHFDPHFFGISPREARSMDPQQRLLLEVAWEALENAGQSPDKLSGSQTGVFVGVTFNDYVQVQSQLNSPERWGPYRITGGLLNSIAGRVSYTLGFHGPALVVDTACSSSLVAVHLAVQSLLNGDADMALAAGVNLLLSPDISISACRSNMLAPDGRCKTFDARADGFIRSDGCGVLVLKRLSDALAHGDRVLAVIRGSASNHDGFSSGFTVPSRQAQEAVIRRALEKARVTPDLIGYVEAHGTGTSLGDPIEVRALAGVFGPGRPADRPLLLGSVKTNMGHCEAAAGVAGLIKVVLSLYHRQIPPHLHFQSPNPFIPWDEMPLEVPTRLMPWEPIEGRWLAGVSSFGVSGINAHVIVEAAPQVDPPPQAEENTLHVLSLSAKTERALQELAARYRSVLEKSQDLEPADICFTAGAGRAHFTHRLAVTGETRDELLQGLAAWSEARPASNVFSGQNLEQQPPRVAFLFSGHGAQYPGMGSSLYRSQAVFRQAVDECAQAFQPYLEKPLLEVMYPQTDEVPPEFSGMQYTQAALFTLEYALSRLWRSWGVEPAAVAGHSIGEYAAACAAGILNLPDAVKLVAARGRLMDSLPEAGAMAVVFAAEEQVAQILTKVEGKISIAVINGPDNIVISGERQAVAAARDILSAEGIRSRLLDVAQASHSPLVEPVLDEFERTAAGISYGLPQVDYVSCLTGDRINGDAASNPGYWRRHLRQTVRFAAAVQRLHELGCTIFIEIGPAPTLISLGKRCLPEDAGLWLPSIKKERDDREQIMLSLAGLYARGGSIDWERVYEGQPRQRVELPTYPFQRQRYWVQAGPHSSRNRITGSAHPLAGQRLPTAGKEIIYESFISLEAIPFLADHHVHGNAVLPAAAFVEMAARVVREALHLERQPVLEDIVFLEPLVIPAEGELCLQSVVSTQADGQMLLDIFSQAEEPVKWKRHLSARLVLTTEPDAQGGASLAHLRESCPREIPVPDFYQELQGRGLVFGPAFRGLARLYTSTDEALGEVIRPASLPADSGTYFLHPALFDAGLQAAAALLPAGEQAYLPFEMGRVRLYRPLPGHFWSHVRRVNDSQGSSLRVDVRLLDENEAVLAEISGLTLMKARFEGGPTDLDDSLYQVTWKPVQILSEAQPPVHWSAEIAEHLQQKLAEISRDPQYSVYQQQAVPRLDELCAAHIQNALLDLGWDLQPGDQFTLEQVGDRLQADSRHRKLLNRLLEILCEDGLLLRHDSTWEVRLPLQRQDASALAEVLVHEHPDSEPEVVLVQRFGEHLAQGLRGAANPLDLLFPGGSLEDASRLYRDAPFTRGFNLLAGEVVQALLKSNGSGRSPRILEIGAGTGGTTEHVLAALGDAPVDYTFTDISLLFLNQAQRRFRGRSGMQFKKLDIEISPQEQGFAAGQYDLVLASNVLHATRDLRTTLRHVHELLAPQGMLVLVEGIQKQRFADLIVGLTEGWWLFSDLDLRPDYPLISAQQWVDLLASEGFSQPLALSGKQVLSNQAVLVAQAPGAPVELPAGRWLIFGDHAGLGEELHRQIQNRAGTAVLALAGESYQSIDENTYSIDPCAAEDFARLLQEAASGELSGVVYLWGLDHSEPSLFQERAAGGLLHLTQALARSGRQLPQGLWLITPGVHAIPSAGGRLGAAPDAATLWGLGKVISQEHPELNPRLLDLDPAAPVGDQAASLAAALLGSSSEDQLALRSGHWFAPRLERLQRDNSPAQLEKTLPAAYRIAPSERGALEELTFEPLNRSAPGPGEVEIQVQASGLGFRDVLIALDMYPGERTLGSECSGVISAVGPGVTGLQPGDEVFAMAPGCFASHVVTPAAFVCRKPAHLSMAEAAALPSAFLTAIYALQHLGKLQAGERVLIHAAAGGVGQAALQIALNAGAEVFATAGSPQKRALLKSLGAHHVFDSRSLDFAGQILELTGGQGVDLVLNSLSDEFITASVDVLAKNGRFIEIGKRGIWSTERFAQVRPEAVYHVVDLLQTARQDPEQIAVMFQELLAALQEGKLRPLPLRIFPVKNALEAFRTMAQARHTGKLVLVHDPELARPRLRPDATYLITGGMGGLGLEVARWLVQQGARHLVLAGRSAPSPQAQAVIQELEQAGAHVRAVQADAASKDDLRRLVAEIEAGPAPLRGVFHAAGALDDGVLVQQNWSRFARVFAPKVDGGWNLHQATLHLPLDFFVIFSSVVSLLGSPGQGNHVAASAYLDALAHYRRAQGLPVLCIDWGPWERVGAAAGEKLSAHLQERGLRHMSPEQGIELLARLMGFDSFPAPAAVQVGAVQVDWEQFARQFEPHPAPAVFSDLIAEARTRQAARSSPDGRGTAGPSTAEPDLMEQLRLAPSSKRTSLMRAYVHEKILKVLDLDPAFVLNPNQPLLELGLDSLMAVELRNLLASGLKLSSPLPATLVFDYTTPEALAQYLLRQAFPESDGKAEEPQGDDAAGAAVQALDDLTDEEAEALLLAELNALNRDKQEG